MNTHNGDTEKWCGWFTGDFRRFTCSHWNKQNFFLSHCSSWTARAGDCHELTVFHRRVSNVLFIYTWNLSMGHVDTKRAANIFSVYNIKCVHRCWQLRCAIVLRLHHMNMNRLYCINMMKAIDYSFLLRITQLFFCLSPNYPLSVHSFLQMNVHIYS